MFKNRKNNYLLNGANNMLIDLPAPTNLNNMWNFGSTLGVCLLIQILTGILLAMQYSSNITIAFDCINHINRDVFMGWMLRNSHANGASLFFIMIYLHMFRGLYYNSYSLKSTWNFGVILLLLTMGTAFMGYVLPWGQMSFWGATVITNLISAIPFFGKDLVNWVWGGFSVDNATLTRFFSLHYLLPMVISLVTMMHLVSLHINKSSNPVGVLNNMDKIPFDPFYKMKDVTWIMGVLLLFFLLSFVSPFLLMDAENFTPANPLSTPNHIQPEWYFLFAYTILRSIPNKLGGVIALLASIVLLLPLSLTKLTSQTPSHNFKKLIFWSYVSVFVMLTWLGTKVVEEPYIMMSQLMSVIYFSIILTWLIV